MKDIIIELFKFVKESSLSKVLLIFLGLPGLVGMTLGISGKFAEWAGVSPTWRYVSFTLGVIFLMVAVAQLLVQFSFSRLRDWLSDQFVSKAMKKIESNTDALVNNAIERLDNHSQSLLEKAAGTFDEERLQLQRIQSDLVNKVEDSTRRVLEGFPKIFDRAYQLIQQAEKEIWLVNFTLEFGRVHCENDTVTKTYQEDFGRDFEIDVRNFYLTLQTKVQQVPFVNVLTIKNDVAYEKFMKPLIKRSGYESLQSTVSDPEMLTDAFGDDRPRPKYELLLKAMETAQEYFVDDVVRARKERFRNRTGHQYCCFQRSSLPIQLLIAGLSSSNSQSANKYGCVVFMLGSDMIESTESGKEVGIYTELDDLVTVMKNLAWTLMQSDGPLVSYPPRNSALPSPPPHRSSESTPLDVAH